MTFLDKYITIDYRNIFSMVLAVFAFLAGMAVTFSVATPLMASIIGELFQIEVSPMDIFPLRLMLEKSTNYMSVPSDMELEKIKMMR